MITFSMDKSVRDSIVAALRFHHDDPRLFGRLTGAIRREEMPSWLAILCEVSPAERDGTYRFAITDAGGALVWRAYAIAEITAGRGRLATLRAHSTSLGIKSFEPAFDYICRQMQGRGVRPCRDGRHNCWSDVTDWVVNDGAAEEPRKRWARSTWGRRARAHEAYIAAGLANGGTNVWRPEATLLFVTPRAEPTPKTLSPADDAFLASLA
ncbi:hypothetical protein ACQR1I_35475 [Bradyrhizobium sp. HKCCYLS2038]|uniref:hypothetical protein n=1 Tax=unclassified Bradyrhizobium TaxID=2631580 RepID=UPI003EB96CE4